MKLVGERNKLCFQVQFIEIKKSRLRHLAWEQITDIDEVFCIFEPIFLLGFAFFWCRDNRPNADNGFKAQKGLLYHLNAEIAEQIRQYHLQIIHRMLIGCTYQTRQK